MLVQSCEDGKEVFTCVKVKGTRSKSSLKRSVTKKSTNRDYAVYSAASAYRARVIMVRPILG